MDDRFPYAVQQKLMEQVLLVAQRLGEPAVASLPLFVENDLKAPLAYTNMRGIYCRRDVAEKYASQFGTILCHEIMHHVVKQPEKTAGFPHDTVNRAEDYIINWLQFKLWGFDVRKIPLKLLWNPEYGEMDLPALCGCIKGKGRLSCGHRGSAHPVIQQVAYRVRKRFHINLESNKNHINYDAMDERHYLRTVYMMQDRNLIPFIPSDFERLVRSLFMKAYLKNPQPEPLARREIDSEQAVLFGWHNRRLRSTTVENPEESMLAVLTWLRVLTEHQLILDRRVWAALHTLESRTKKLAKAIKKRDKLRPKAAIKPKKWCKRLAEVARWKASIKDAEALVARKEDKAEWPIHRLLDEHQVYGVTRKLNSAPKTLSLANIRQEMEEEWLGSLAQLPRISGKRVPAVLKELSRISAADLERLLDLKDKMGKAFASFTAPEKDKSDDEIEKEIEDFIRSKAPTPDPDDQNDPADAGSGQGDAGEAGDDGANDDAVGDSDDPDAGAGSGDEPGQEDGDGTGDENDNSAGDPDSSGPSELPDMDDEPAGSGDGDDSDDEGGSDEADEDDDDDDLDVSTGPGGGPGAGGAGKTGKGGRPKNLWGHISSIHDGEMVKLAEVLEYMTFFETQLTLKPRKSPDPNSNEIATVPMFGNDLNRVDTAEFALLSNPATKMLFLSKFASGGLSMRMPRQKKRKAVIISIDCSGSMMGERYAMASGFALAMVKLLEKDKRGWGVQLWTTEKVGEIYNDGRNRSGNTISDVIALILSPRWGGTNFANALHEAFDLRDKAGWKEGISCLFVSDGEDNIHEDEKVALKRRKGNQDQLTGILVKEGGFNALEGLADERFKLKKSQLQTKLVAIGNNLL